MRDVCRQFFFDVISEFFIEHIAFADGDDESLVHQFGVIAFEFAPQDFEFLSVVLAVGGYEEQQDRIAFDMS